MLNNDQILRCLTQCPHCDLGFCGFREADPDYDGETAPSEEGFVVPEACPFILEFLYEAEDEKLKYSDWTLDAK